MNRVVKTAIAVTTFGLAAAAMAVPAQAEVQHNTARYAPIDGPAAGTTAGSPLGSLVGGLVGGGLLKGLLGPKAKPARPMTEAERDAASENQAEPGMAAANGAEDVTRLGGPLPELSPLVAGIPLAAGGGLTGSLPVLGAARMAQPATPTVKAGKTETATQGTIVNGAVSQVTGTLNSSVGGAVGKLSGTGLLPATSVSAKGFESLSGDSVLGGLSDAARRALPTATSGELSPMIGKVAPAEMAPVIEALPATSQAASMDELTPLVEDSSALVTSSGTKTARSYSDVIAALGWSSDALTSSVRDRWVRN
jgi:hypothetical protein